MRPLKRASPEIAIFATRRLFALLFLTLRLRTRSWPRRGAPVDPREGGGGLIVLVGAAIKLPLRLAAIICIGRTCGMAIYAPVGILIGAFKAEDFKVMRRG